LEQRQPWPTADDVLGNDLQTSHNYVKALHIDTSSLMPSSARALNCPAHSETGKGTALDESQELTLIFV